MFQPCLLSDDILLGGNGSDFHFVDKTFENNWWWAGRAHAIQNGHLHVPLLAVAHLPDIVQLGGVRHYRGLLSASVVIAAQKQPQKRNAKPKQIQNTHTHKQQRNGARNQTQPGEGRVRFTLIHTHTLNSLHASVAPAIKTSQRTNQSKEDDDHTFAKTRGQLVSAAVTSETILSVLTKSCLRVKMIENSAASPPGKGCVFF